MRNSFAKYQYVKQYIRELNISYKQAIVPYLLSYLIAVLVFSGPIAICINLLIFVDYTILLSGLLGLFLSLILTLGKILYYNYILKDEKVDGIRYYYLYDGLISAVFMVLIMIFLF